jgi:hypothetical protein
MNTNTENVLLKLNLDDLLSRWQKARIAAVCKSVQELVEGLTEVAEFAELQNEQELVDRYFSLKAENEEEKNKQKDLLLKNVFDNSRKLAISFSKFAEMSFEIQDFQFLLSRSQIPCVQGSWESRDKTRVLTRKGCEFCVKSSANACDYWREALDGLVMGLGENERLARHASVRHGDSACVDVFYFDGEGKKETSLAWGPIPEHMSEPLKLICDDFETKMKTSVDIKGLSEGVLYFEFKSSTDNMCGGGNLLTSTFLRKVQKKYPGVRVHEVTPRAVIGAGV